LQRGSIRLRKGTQGPAVLYDILQVSIRWEIHFGWNSVFNPNFFGYFLWPKTCLFFNQKTWNCCCIQVLVILITLVLQCCFLSLRHFGHFLTVVIKLAVTMFITQYFQTFWQKWLFGHFKKILVMTY